MEHTVLLGLKKYYRYLTFFKMYFLLGVREMAPKLGALAALAEDLNSILSTHMAAHSCL